MFDKLVDKFGSKYREGTVVFREGDSGDEMFIIHEGEVKIFLKARAAEQVLAILGAGDFFGEMAVFTDKARSATAVVSDDSTLLKISRSSIEYIIENNPSFAQNLIQKLCNRLYTTNIKVEELLVLSKETRVLKAVIAFWKEFGIKDASGENLLISLKPFVEHVGGNLGIEAGECRRVLMQLRDQKMLRFRKDQNGNQYIAFTKKIFQYFDVL